MPVKKKPVKKSKVVTGNEQKKGLTQKQILFCQYYIEDWNATKAALKAGYSEDTSYSIGNENLKKPEILSYIKEVQKDIEKVAGISRLKILNEHIKLAFSSIAHLHLTWITRKEFEQLTEEQKSCIQEISTKTNTVFDSVKKQPVEVEYIKIKLYDKQKSLDSISKMLGYNEPEKIEHSGEIKGDLSILSTEELLKRAEAAKAIERG